MASTNRSASPSSEGGYDILTPTASIPDTAKEPSEHDVPNTATGFSAHRKFCRDLVELERWAPIVGSLLDHEMAKMAEMSQFFREKFFTLSRHLPTGTEEQQFESLERLTKLRQGPLAKRMNAISNALLSESILRRVRALGSEVPALDHKVTEWPSRRQTSDLTPTTVPPAVDVSVADNAAIKPSIGRPNEMLGVTLEGIRGSIDCETRTFTSKTIGRGRSEVCTNKGSFLRRAAESVLLSEDNKVTVRLNDRRTWELNFENREDAVAVASDLAA